MMISIVGAIIMIRKQCDHGDDNDVDDDFLMMTIISIYHLTTTCIIEKALGRFSVHGWIVLKRNIFIFLQKKLFISIHAEVGRSTIWFLSYPQAVILPCRSYMLGPSGKISSTLRSPGQLFSHYGRHRLVRLN